MNGLENRRNIQGFKIHCRGWGDGSVCKLFATQAWGPVFGSPASIKSQAWQGVSANPVLRKQRHEASWSLLTSQSPQVGKLQAQWETLSQKIKWAATKEDTYSQPLASIHTCEHTYAQAHTLKDLYTHTHLYIHKRNITAISEWDICKGFHPHFHLYQIIKTIVILPIFSTYDSIKSNFSFLNVLQMK